jgi:hypothetical protein
MRFISEAVNFFIENDIGRQVPEVGAVDEFRVRLEELGEGVQLEVMSQGVHQDLYSF